MRKREPQFRDEVRALLNSLPNAKQGPDPLSEEAYFYGARNFAHFHGPSHIDIRLSLEHQKRHPREGRSTSPPICSSGRPGFMLA